jgi:hypothetical protein
MGGACTYFGVNKKGRIVIMSIMDSMLKIYLILQGNEQGCRSILPAKGHVELKEVI